MPEVGKEKRMHFYRRPEVSCDSPVRDRTCPKYSSCHHMQCMAGSCLATGTWPRCGRFEKETSEV